MPNKRPLIRVPRPHARDFCHLGHLGVLKTFFFFFLKCAVSEGSGNPATDTVGGTNSLHLVLIEQFHMRGSAAVLNIHFASCNVAVDVRVTFGAKTAATKAKPDSNTMSKRHNEISRNGSYCVNYTGRLVFVFISTKRD